MPTLSPAVTCPAEPCSPRKHLLLYEGPDLLSGCRCPGCQERSECLLPFKPAYCQFPCRRKGSDLPAYMLGERSPRWNPHAFGTFLGIRPEHNRNDYLRAALEGVAMNLELILKAYRRSMTADHLVLTGAAQRGDIVASILADVLKASLSRPDHVEEATSIAAAVTAGGVSASTRTSPRYPAV